MILYAFVVSILFSVATSVLCGAEELTLPVTTCKRNSADYSICLKVALQEAWPQFCEGLPEFDFPSMKPFLLKYGKLVVDRNDVYVEGIITNTTIFGPENFRFLDVRPYFLNDVFRLEIDTQLPKMFAHVYAAGQANIGGIRLSGTGQVNLTVNEIKLTWDITGHVTNDTWTVEHFQLIMTIESLNFILYSFDGDTSLGNLVQIFVNEYWPPLYRIGWPFVAKMVEPTLIDISNNLFSKVSLSKVFP